MAKPIVIAYTFQTQVGPIPLSQLDADIAACSGAINDLSTYGNYLVDTSGAANTIIVTTAPGLTFAYAAGVPLQVKLASTNTSTVVNVNVNGLGNQLVLNNDGSAPGVASLLAGSILNLMYDGIVFRLLGSATGSFASIVVGAPTGGNQGTGTVNATGLFVNGTSAAPIVRYKTASTSRANNAVSSLDPDLVANVQNGKSYAFKIVCQLAGGAGGIQVGTAGTATASFGYAYGISRMNSAFLSGISANVFAGGGILLASITTAISGDWMELTGGFTCNASGTFGLSWAQNASNAAATIVNPGSYMILTPAT
jgi:hypothetical protein